MSEQPPKAGRGFSFNLNSLLVLVTLAGGILFVSQKLTSDRPVAPPSKPADAIGGQTLEARLWEDPFHPKKDKNDRHPAVTLTNEITARIIDGDQVLLLPVMVSGGPYSEDQESRIRSRFAVVSALGQRGYAPEDAEHIGIAEMWWPTTSELDEWKGKTNAGWGIERNSTDAAAVATNAAATNVAGSVTLPVRFEWYRARDFHPHEKDAASRAKVLVLWLDDSFFEDTPLLRLPLLLKPLIAAADTNTSSTRIVVNLIGPRRSSTLRAMLPDEFAKPGHIPFAATNANLWNAATNTLSRIGLYSATANAMDEVLVMTNVVGFPRKAVRDRLLATGFKEARFFNATDAQLADEILQELKLRDADLSNPKNHLVLISEWDTFYGRMLSLTYGATLSIYQTNSRTDGAISTREQFVEKFRHLNQELPANFHPFVYLRGLDGRTVGGTADAADKADQSKRNHPKLDSIEDFVLWTPDVNKAEGPGQFDYLSRTGEWMEALRTQIKRHDTASEIKAVGIVGSDAYDTLLILQALRHRFPDVLFFTTDLDARFWHPTEREWSRNLIVASSYGLRLHPDLQKDVAPFRDSSQTAQFAATLAALGHPNLANVDSVSPRRFEIGHRMAVDLSVTNPVLAANNLTDTTRPSWLHPLTRSEEHTLHPEYAWRRPVNLSLGAGALALALAAYFWWSPFRRRAYDDCGYFSQSLPFEDPDVGGPDGAELLIWEIFQKEGKDDPFCRWMADELTKWNKKNAILFPPTSPPSPAGGYSSGSGTGRPETAEEKSERIKRETVKVQRFNALIGVLNQILHHRTPVDEKKVLESTLVDPGLVRRARPWNKAIPCWKSPMRREQRWRTRQFLDDFLHRLTLNSPAPKHLSLIVAQDARASAGKLFWIGAQNLFFFVPLVVLLVVVAAKMGATIWADMFARATGEHFSLTSGTSAWPNVLLRVLSTALAFSFIFVLIAQLRSMFHNLSRKYRIPLQSDGVPQGARHICATQLWEEFHDEGHFCWRLLRAGIPCLLYFIFAFLILQLLGFHFQPLRGVAVEFWAAKIRYPFVLSFLLLGFLTIDASLRCRRFIDVLSAAPTDYPQTTRSYFKSQRGDVGEEYLDEWIDMNLIADLTEWVGGLLWFPSIVFLVMLASLNQWTDHWPTSHGLMIILVLNFAIAIASVLILQRAAHKAKSRAEESLYAKLKKAQAEVAPTSQHNDAAQAEKLLDEIRNLHRGAFVGFWENPVVGALFLAPGGTAILALLQYLATR